MNQDTKNQINLTIIKRVRKELLINKAPLSAYWLADRIKTIEIQIPEKTEDIISEPTYSASKATSNSSGIQCIDVDPDMIIDSITNTTVKDFYFDDDRIGLKIFWVHEVYNLIKSFCSTKQGGCFLSDLMKYIENLVISQITILPVSSLEVKNGRSELNSIVWQVLLQFPKVFKMNSNRTYITLQKKEDLKNFIAKTIFQRGKQLIVNNDYFSQLGKQEILELVNTTENYFLEYQKPLVLSDLNAIQKGNNNWFDDYGDSIVFKDLAPLKENLRNHYGRLLLPHQGTAIFAFYFIGEHFPLPEAETFVKLSQIIYLKKFSWYDHSDISGFEDIVVKKFELWTLLTALIKNNDDPVKWFKENITISYIRPENLPYTLDQIYQKLISHYSPIFNIDENPGNLFRITLQEKLEKQQLNAK